MFLTKKKTQNSLLTLTILFTLTLPAFAQNNRYNSASDLQIVSKSIASASAGRDLALSSVQVDYKLAAGRNITCTGCAIGGSLSAGNNVSLNACPEVHNIAAGQDAEIIHSKVLQSIAAGHDVTLHNTSVAQRVSAGNQVALERSAVQGLISVGGHLATLDDSKASDILFSRQNNTIGSGIVIGGNNIATVKIGPNGLSAINGFTIKGAMNQTTVITPEQSIYVNGTKVSGEGPSSYQAYQATNPEAPTVYGPGWEQSAAEVSRKSNGTIANKKKVENKPVVNILELRNNSVVSGQVEFDSGYGKIIIYPGSQFLGKVVNGFVEKKSR